MIIGIVGAGRFGSLLHTHLSTDNTIVLVDQADSKQALQKCELVIFAVPNRILAQVVEETRPFIAPRATVMDVGSIKVLPCRILSDAFSGNVLGTHPLFGPDSAAESWQGHKMVFCRIQVADDMYAQVQELFRQRGVEIIETTPDEHDHMMAQTQALVHFIGRALTGLKDQHIATPDYEHLLAMMQKVTNDTWELFFDMQNLNPYAEEVRRQFIQKLNKLEESIHNDNTQRSTH